MTETKRSPPPVIKRTEEIDALDELLVELGAVLGLLDDHAVEHVAIDDPHDGVGFGLQHTQTHHSGVVYNSLRAHI